MAVVVEYSLFKMFDPISALCFRISAYARLQFTYKVIYF